jgi:hypothetical protein
LVETGKAAPAGAGLHAVLLLNTLPCRRKSNPLEVGMLRTLSSVLLVSFLLMTIIVIPKRTVAADWENLKISGDLRYRHEMIDDETKDEVRNRHRIRARIMLDAMVTDAIDVGLRLASGSDDPISTNQTLGDGFTSKGIQLDLAYFDVRPASVKGLHIVGGKMKNPYHRPAGMGLIWDGDLNPEGLALRYNVKNAAENTKLFVSAGYMWVIENGQDDDVNLIGGQTGATVKLGQADLTAGVGYFTYTNADDFLGMEYNELELFGEVGMKLGAQPFALVFDYVMNNDADEEDTGMLVGATFGKKKNPGSWDVKVFYEELKANAVLPEFTDSDFGGGGTNAKGLILGAGIRVMEKADLGATYFINTRHIAEGQDETDYNRLQVDFAFKI